MEVRLVSVARVALSGMVACAQVSTVRIAPLARISWWDVWLRALLVNHMLNELRKVERNSTHRLLVRMSVMILNFSMVVILRPLTREILLLLTSWLLMRVVSSVPLLPTISRLSAVHWILIPALVYWIYRSYLLTMCLSLRLESYQGVGRLVAMVRQCLLDY